MYIAASNLLLLHSLINPISENSFLASQDALEVMLVSQWVSQLLTLRTELTDVTPVSEDTEDFTVATLAIYDTYGDD